MTFIFRCDSSEFIGNGHIMRCLNIAKEIKNRGIDSIFISNTFEGNINKKVEHYFKVLELPKKNRNLKEKNFHDQNKNQIYKEWLGCGEEEDAINSLKLIYNIKNLTIDWLIVDHYSLGEVWENKLRKGLKKFNEFKNKKEPKIFVIDDLFNRKHSCDILLNQNYFKNINPRKYEDVLNKDSRLLIGPHYALLGKEYFGLNNLTIKRNQCRRILIYFGGVENSIHQKLIESISNEKFSEISFDYVISEKSKHYSYLKKCEKKLHNLNVYNTQETLSGFILRSDLFIGAGGGTALERLCLGIPSLVIILADNQKEISENLEKDKYIKLIGHGNLINPKDISKAIEAFINKKILLKDGKDLVDGFGTNRVVNNLLGIDLPIQLSINDYDKLVNKFENYNQILNEKLNLKNHNNIYKPEFYENNISNNPSIKLNFIFFKTIYDNLLTPIGKLIFLNDNSNKIFFRVIIDHYSDSDLKTLFINLIPLTFKCLRENFALKKYNFLNLCENNLFLIEKILYPHSKKKNPNKRINYITILTDEDSWLNEYIPSLIINLWHQGYEVRWIHSLNDLRSGDVCLILYFSKIINEEKLILHKNNLVVHESDLPLGKGFSPMSWQILEGKNKIKISLIDADLSVDSGEIHMQENINLDGNELVNDWRKIQADKTISLCMEWINNYPDILSQKRSQIGEETFYSRRDKSDSEIDINKSIKEQFNKLRIVDNKKYPAFLSINKKIYTISIDHFKDI